MQEHPLQSFFDEWETPWLNVFLEQYEQILEEVESSLGCKLGPKVKLAVGMHGNIHAFHCKVRVVLPPGRSWTQRAKDFFLPNSVEFVRLFPLGSNDEVLAAGVICQDPRLEESIRFHFDAHADSLGMKVNWDYMW